MSTWTFGPFRLLTAQRALLEGDRPVRLGSRAFDILVALVERAGELVRRDELIAYAWPNIFVDDSTLRVHIAALRKVLGHGQGGARTIVSVSGRGYRFTAPVVREALAAPALPDAAGRQRPAISYLPAPLSRMVGRGALVGELAGRLAARRFLTIVGPGGMGKTTVAIALAERLSATYRDGARFVDLASLATPQLVADAVARVVEVQSFSGDPLADLLAYLRERQMLLLLDNCEHVVDAVAVLAEAVFANAPGVHILATSREPLRVAGEFVCRLPPLALPAQPAHLTAADALGFSAVNLFVERAIASLDGFILTDADVPVVVEICRRLDGIPLAIELAAARVDFYGLRGLAQRLGDAVMALTAVRRTALARQKTLRATLDWSHGILSAEEQTILRRLAVFRSGFSLESAVAVAADAAITGVQVMNGIANLAAKSLVTADVSGAAVQYRLLDITRTYAAQKLSTAGETAVIARRHAVQCCALVATAESDVAVLTRGEWLDTYGRLVDDLRAALGWAFSAAGDAAIGIELTVASAPLWFQLSLMAEYGERAERALKRHTAEAGSDRVMEMRLLVAFGSALWYGANDAASMRPVFTRALAIAEQIGDTSVQLQALWGVWAAQRGQGEFRQALAVATSYEQLAGKVGDKRFMLLGDRMLALTHHYLGAQGLARTYLERVRSQTRGSDRPLDTDWQLDAEVATTALLARILWLQGLPDQARRSAQDAIDAARRADHRFSVCYALYMAACPISLWVGDLAEAQHRIAMLCDLGAGNPVVDRSARYLSAVLRLRQGSDSDMLIASCIEPRLEVSQLTAVADLVSARTVVVPRPEADPAEDLWNSPELLRVSAELLLWHGGPGSADAAAAKLLRALDGARRQGALSWELRAALSLARLRRDPRGDQAEDATAAREMLRSVYDRFTEGYDTADLRAARDFLAAPPALAACT